MKKVKFTLGLMLAILFIGANVSYAADLLPEKLDKGYFYQKGDQLLGGYVIPVGLTVDPSSFYANNEPIVSFTGTNQAIEAGILVNGVSTGTYGYIAYGLDAAGNPIDIRLEGVAYDPPYGTFPTYYEFAELDTFLMNDKKVEEYAKIKLRYDDGNETMTFLKRTIILGKMMYDPDLDQNTFVPSGLYVEDMLTPIDIDYKPFFTEGSGIATYTYKQNLTELYKKYPIYAMYYEIWTNDETNTPYVKNYGEGNAYPLTNRTLKVDAAAGITTSHKEWELIKSGYDYTIDVYADAGKELEISTNSEFWTKDNGGIKIVPNGAGRWKVTLTKLRVTLTVKIGYKAALESAGGGDGQTDIGTIIEDKVWGSGGTLYVKSAGEGSLSIYSVTGQLINTKVINGDYSLTLPKGLYIIKLKNKAYKAIL